MGFDLKNIKIAGHAVQTTDKNKTEPLKILDKNANLKDVKFDKKKGKVDELNSIIECVKEKTLKKSDIIDKVIDFINDHYNVDEEPDI
jgi:cob(I)alamin adenosyltransferase